MLSKLFSLLLIAAIWIPTPLLAAPETVVFSDAVADNHLAYDGDFAAHILRFKKKSRVVVAFPAGNSGAMLTFAAPTPPIRMLRIDGFKPAPDGIGQTLLCTVEIPGASATLGDVVLGSLREVRRALDGPPLSYETEVVTRFEEAVGKLSAPSRNLLENKGIFATQPRDTLESKWQAGTVGNERVISLNRQEYLGEREYRLRLGIPANCKALGGKQLRITCPPDQPLQITLSITTPYAPLPRIPEHELLTPGALKLARSESGDAASKPLLQAALQSLQFLATREKLLAGSFRFLTYFGRDTLLTARMMIPIAGENLLDAAYRSVLDRLSPSGEVAHEENLGNQAILSRMERFTTLLEAGKRVQAMEILKSFGQPIYDYKMVDDNFMLAPLARDLLTVTTLNDAARSRLIKGNDDSRLTQLATNLEFVLTAADCEAFEKHGLPLQTGQKVGNWRDSQEGLGGGLYPGDVNAFLLPSAITAIGEILNHPFMTQVGFKKIISKGNLPSLYRAAEDPAWLNSLLSRWETIGKKYHMNHPLPHMRSHIKAWLASVTPEEKTWFDKQLVAENCPLSVFVTSRCYPQELASGLQFVTLALDASGNQVPVLNSDIVFALFDAPLPDDVLVDYLRALSLPFPLGLWTPVGPLVANPVYANNPGVNRTFGSDRYHGMVIWGWVQGMLELGLRKQRAWLEELSGGCGLACDALDRLDRQLAAARRNVAGLATSELWSWAIRDNAMVPVAFGATAKHETLANAVQLWSTVWLSVYQTLASKE
jgi:hypothetical protein